MTMTDLPSDERSCDFCLNSSEAECKTDSFCNVLGYVVSSEYSAPSCEHYDEDSELVELCRRKGWL